MITGFILSAVAGFLIGFFGMKMALEKEFPMIPSAILVVLTGGLSGYVMMFIALTLHLP